MCLVLRPVGQGSLSFYIDHAKAFVSLVIHVYKDRLKSSDICGWGRLGDRIFGNAKAEDSGLYSNLSGYETGNVGIPFVPETNCNIFQGVPLYFVCGHVVLCLFRSRNKELVTVRLYSAQRPRTRCPFSLKLPISCRPRMPSVYGDQRIFFQTLFSVDTRVYLKRCLYVYQSAHSGKKI